MMDLIRGILQSFTDGVVRFVSATGRSGETFSRAEFLQHYGFSSRPKEGAELLVHVRGNVVTVIGSDDRRYRLTLRDGEAALHDDLGQKVHLTREGIVAESLTAITALAPQINLGGEPGALLRLIDERILAMINSHTHNGSPPPDVPITAEMVCTVTTKAA